MGGHAGMGHPTSCAVCGARLLFGACCVQFEPDGSTCDALRDSPLPPKCCTAGTHRKTAAYNRNTELHVTSRALEYTCAVESFLSQGLRFLCRWRCRPRTLERALCS